MKEEPRPDSRSSVTSADSDLSDKHGVKIKSSLAAAAAATPALKSKLSFGISRLLDEPKKQEAEAEESTDDEEDEMQDGSASPVTRSGSSHESSQQQMHPHHPLHPQDPHNQHISPSGHMYSYSPAFPWFGSYVGKEGIPSKFTLSLSLFAAGIQSGELNAPKGSLLIDFLWLLK